MGTSPSLSPRSRFTAADLADRAAETVEKILEDVREQERGRHLPAVSEELVRALTEIGRWMRSEKPSDPDAMSQAFRRLATAFRNRNVSLDDALGELEVLEHLLVEGPDAGPDDFTPARSFRHALRLLWREMFTVNHALTRRREQDRLVPLHRFGEVLSHELGNRLGAVQTGVFVLRDQEERIGEDRRRELLTLIEEGVEAALSTVEDVASFMLSTTWQDEELQPFSEVAVHVVQGLRPLARDHRVRLELGGDELPEAEVDGGRIRLVVSNFLVNGIRYADREKEDSWVRLDARIEDGELVIEVSDNGVGISDADQERIFEFRTRGGGTDGEEGMGMGLTIAAEAVAQLGGRTGVESQLGEGTTFRAILPLNGTS